MYKLLLVFLFFCFSLEAFSQNEGFDQAKKYFADGKAKKALNLINKTIEINSDSAKYYILKAKIAYKLHSDFDEFFLLLNKSVDVEPENPYPLMNRGYYYDMVKQKNNAILDYNDALKLATEDSTIVSILASRGGIFFSIRKLELAKEDLERAYAMDSNDLPVMNNLAMALDGLGDTAEATTILKRMVQVDSTQVSAWMNLGFQSSTLEQYDDALFYLNKAVDVLEDRDDDVLGVILNNRGYTKLKMGDINGALKDIKKAISLKPDNSYAYRNMALVYLETKDNEKACENLYLAKRYGYTQYYGDDVEEMLKENCNN